MSATYVLPLSTDVHRLRFLIGDTATTSALLDDDEIEYLLELTADDLDRATASAYWRIAAKFSRLADVSEGDVSLKASQKAANYRELAKAADTAIETGSAGVAAAPAYLGGISRSDVRARQDDTDRVPAFFARGRPPSGPESAERWDR